MTVVKLLKDEPGLTRLVSGDADGEIRIWDETQAGEVRPVRDGSRPWTHHIKQFTCSMSWKAHDGSISAIGAPPSCEGVLQHHVLTGASDGAIKLWDLSSGTSAKMIQEINPKGRLPLDIEVAYLPDSRGWFPHHKVLPPAKLPSSRASYCLHGAQDTALYVGGGDRKYGLGVLNLGLDLPAEIP